jgi:CBS domain containing-hemolysin-like protein
LEGWLGWVALAGSVALLLFATTANLALRLPSRARLAEKMALRGRKNELEALLEHRVRLLLATASLRAASFLGFATLLVHWLVGVRGEASPRTLVYAFLISFPIVLLFGIAIPNAWARYGGESLLVSSLPLLHLLRCVLYPIVKPLEAVDWIGRRLAGAHTGDADDAINELEQEILTVLSESEAQGGVDEEQKEMIESVIELRDRRVHEIMTPRTEICAVEKNISLSELKQFIHEKGHSRIPVFDGTVDHILGIIYAKDLLQIDSGQPFDARKTMRQAVYIPENKQLRELLHEFRAGQGHMAIVLDEYGGTAGLVTIEDILEEVVGEIVDEHEAQDPEPLRRINESTVEVDARMRIEILNDQLGVRLPESEDYETVGGFVFSVLGRIPQAGEKCEYANVRLTVTEAESRKINRLRIEVLPDAVPAEAPT